MKVRKRDVRRVEKKSLKNNLPLHWAYSKLSRRQCDILKEISENKSNREIAETLFISKKTVENHITNIGKALNLQGKGAVRKWVNSNTV